MLRAKKLRTRRKFRVRFGIRKKAHGRVRLSVFRSHKHIYAQLIDDTNGTTIAAASSLEKDMRTKVKSGGNKDAATVVGQLLAERAQAKGIKEVVFDRGPYLYHGRIKALAEAARAGGLAF